MKKITQGATRLLVLALGLGLVSTGWAVDPVAIWDGDFSVTQTGYTLDLKGNSLSSDNSIITIDQSVGITVESSGTFSGGFTVLFKYSNLNVALAAKQVLATTTLTDAEARTGVTIGTSGLSCGIWAGGSWNSAGTFNSMNISNQTAGVLGYTHYSSSNYSGGTGTRLFYLKNGVATTILNAGTLGSNNDISKYKGFSIGGLKTTVSGFSAATGMKISGIAVFQGVLSESELKAYVWPSAKVGGVASGAAKYTDWDYADDMVTWALDSTDQLASSTAKFGLFDTHAGSIPLTFVGSANAVFYPNAGGKAEAFWHKLSNGSVSGTYKAPGMALRFSGSATGKSIGGTYGPVTIGGMYVESGASGYSLTQAGNVKRTTILGNPYDPDGVTNSVFRFEEPFTIARTGVLCLSGAINIVLPESGDTLTLNKTADNGNVAYAPQIVQKVTGLSNDGIITIGTHTTPGGTLKMHGEGTIEAVQLTASGATLDFSDLGSRANTTPFINCPLVVDANTVFVFPAGATFPYKVATAISGTAPTTDTVYTDANGNVFTGPISIDAENGTVTFDPLSASTIEVNGALTISGATAANINIPAGKTLTLASGAALTGTVTGSGTVVCNQVDLSGAGFDNASGWTGKVQIAGDASMPTTFFDESSYGNANSTLEITSGHVAITAATALPGTVNVASGATLYMTSSSLTSLAISGTNNGMVNLQAAAALATLSLDNGIARGTIVYPSSLTTLNVSLTETLADDGRASFTCSGATPTNGTLTLTRPDGTTVTQVTGTVEGSTISFAWTPAVSGKACWIDYEMEYQSGNASKTGWENSGTDTANLHSDSSITGADAFNEDTGMLYTYAHPYKNDMVGDKAYPDTWTAVVRCTVPNYPDAAVITFGWNTGFIGLIAGETPDSEMRLVQSTGGNHYVTNAVMKVQNATKAQHVYVFTVETNQSVTVYCDGSLVTNVVYATPFTIATSGNQGGFQIGSILGGKTGGVIRFAKNESPANTLSEEVQKDARIDCVRLYKGVLGPNAIAQLSTEFPAVKLFEATISGGDANVWGSLAWTGGDISTINAYSKAIITVEDDATLTLPASITADELVVNIASGKTLTLVEAGGGTTLTIGKPVEINGGSAAFDVSSKTLDFAIGGTGYVFVDTGKTISVASGGSLSRISGSGTVTYASYGSLPSALAFGAWTGTVVLPSFAANGVNFDNYGKTGSTIALTGITSGWIDPDHSSASAKLRLDGAVNITAMSARTYTFAEIDGTGNLSFATTTQPTAITIAKVAEGYSGIISNTTERDVAITTLDRQAGTTVTPGSKLLTTSGRVAASALTVGGVAQSVTLFTESDGIYVAAASVQKGESTPTYHTTVAAAMTEAGSDAATITLLADTSSDIALAVGQSLVTGGFNVGTVSTGATYYHVVNNAGVYTVVLDTHTITIPSVANTTVSVDYVTGGAAANTTAAGAITVDAGTSLTATWTAASGYKITAGASQTINPVAAAETLAPPTVEAKGATVSGVTFNYGDDFATADVTATVSGDATTYTLTVDGANYEGEVSGSTVTFTNVVTGHASAYDNVSYEISATDGTSPVDVSGGSGSAVVADTTAWFSQSSANAGAPVGGSWETPVNLSTPTNVTDNTFTADSPSTTSRVKMEFNVCFTATSDENVSGEAQGALKLGEVNSATTFMVLKPNGEWEAVSHGAFTPDPTATNKVVMTFDYANNTYSVDVDGHSLTNSSGIANFSLAASRTGVQNIDFAGTGTLVSMKGDQLEGYMVKDNAGGWYATIEAATQSYDSANGPYTVLHDGTAPSGWKIDGSTLIKVATGLFFMAY